MAVNPVLTGERRNQYTSSGSLGPYNFTFVIYADADLSVYVDDTLKTLSTHYTVSTNANGTGSITFTAGNAPASGALVTIIGNKDISRSTRFTSGGPLTADALETEFNTQTALLQQLDEKISRAITLPIETDATRPIEFPYDNTEANNADRIVKFNSAGTALEIGSTSTNIDTLAGIASDISNVSSISADVTAVAADATDIGIVSTNIASVNTVATNINDVIAVANDLAEAVSEVETVANDLNEATSEIDTVANAITNVDTVGTNIGNVNKVANISTNVTTVAGISSDVTNVAGISSDVTSVANISSNVTSVANDATDIGTVASSIANVNTAASNITNINTVAGVSANVTTVAGISGNVTTVAGISSDVTAVANDATDIGTVATNISNVNAVGGISANVTTVAGIASDVTAVANDATDIGTVATNISNINSVAGNSTNINAVAGNATNINAVNSNSSNINTVSGAVTNIGTVASDISNVNTVASNISGVNSFAERYRVEASDPTTSLDQGDLVFNTGASALKYYDGSSWQTIVAGSLTDVVQDGTPQLGGNLDLNSNDITGTGNVNITGTVTATSFSGDGSGLSGVTSVGGATGVDFNDNVKARFGTGNDLEILHDGTNSQIIDSGQGDLYIKGANNIYFQDNTSGDVFARFNNNTNEGNVKLYYNNAEKLATTSAGVSVTGNIAVSGTVDGRDVATDGTKLDGIATGATANTGTVTSVGISPGTGLDAGSAITTSGNISVTLDLSELTDMTADVVGSTDELILLDSGAERRKAINEIKLSQFNNDSGFTSNVGDITNVSAGNGLTGGGASGSVTLNVGAGTGIDVGIDTIAVDVSDFMANGSNNRVLTATGPDGMNAEANMTFDGTTLSVPVISTTGNITAGGNLTSDHVLPNTTDTYDLGSSSKVWRNIYTGDLHLSNEAKDEGNAIDGTKGNWTIQEGAEDLYILNNKTGKKFKFKLEEIS